MAPFFCARQGADVISFIRDLALFRNFVFIRDFVWFRNFAFIRDFTLFRLWDFFP